MENNRLKGDKERINSLIGSRGASVKQIWLNEYRGLCDKHLTKIDALEVASSKF